MISMAAVVSMLFTNIYTNADEERVEVTVTPTPVLTGEPEATVTPTPVLTGEPEVTITPTPILTGEPEVTVTQAPVLTGEPEVTITPTPVLTGEPEVTATPVPTEMPEVTPTPALTQIPEVTPTSVPVPTEVPEPSVTPLPKGAPKLLTLTGGDGSDSLEKMSPAFSPDLYIYHFQDTGNGDRVRTLYVTVEPDVEVTVNGTQVQVDADGNCILTIPYRISGSENDVVLTRSDTGESSTYQFHTYANGIANYSGSYALVNSQGEKDEMNISSLVMTPNTSVYDGTVNLDKVRLEMTVSPGENHVFQAELTDGSGKIIDTFLYAGGEYGDSTVLQSKNLKLQEGENYFYLKCYGTCKWWKDGKYIEEPGVNTVTFRIRRNSTEDPKVNNNANLSGLSLHVNDSGTEYLTDFSPEKKKYEVTLNVEEFEDALENNQMWLNLTAGDPRQQIFVYGGSTMHGSTTATVKMQDKGYGIASYSQNDLYAEDMFTVRICVIASDRITTSVYEIKVTKKGKSGMLIPDIYRNTSFKIVPSRPERKMILVLSSTVIYDNGRKITGAQATADKTMHIELENTDSIELAETQITNSDYTIWLKNPGKTNVKVIYDNGAVHYEDQILVSVYYSQEYLYNEIQAAQKLLDTLKNSDRIYPDAAISTYEDAIGSARLVYNRYANMNLNDEQNQQITDAVTALMQAEEVFKRSETGRKITAFLPLADEIANQNVINGATILKVVRPKTLQVVIDGQTETISGVKWTSRPEWQVNTDSETIYRFTPQLPVGYVAMEGVAYPVITVTRKPKDLAVQVKRTIKLDDSILVQHVPVGTRKSALNLPSYLEMYKHEGVGDDGGRLQIPVRWVDMDGFDGNTPGTYTFHSALNAPSDQFVLAENTTQDPMQTIIVIVDEPKHEEDDPGDGGNGNGDGNGSGTGDGNGSGNGSGTGDGNGSGNGSGTGDGNGSGHGSGNRKPSNSGNNGSHNNRNNQNNQSNQNQGNGGIGNDHSNAGNEPGGQNVQNNSSSPKENTREQSESSARKQTASSKTGGSDGAGGSQIKGNDKKQAANANKQAANANKQAADSGNGDSSGKKNRWKVSQIIEEKAVSHVKEFILLGIVLITLLFYGGFEEYRRHRDDEEKE